MTDNTKDSVPLEDTSRGGGNGESATINNPGDDYDVEAARNKEDGSFNSRHEALSRIRTAQSITMSPELFEKLYLSPEKAVKGNLRQTFANPTPLAIISHAVCACPLGCDLMGLRGSGQFGAASTGAYVFIGGLLLVISGIFEFFLGNTFSFVVFCSFGGFWLSLAGTLIPAFNSVGAYSPTGDSQVLGLTTRGFQASFGFYLTFWCILVMVLLICSLRTNVAFFLLFVCLEATFLCLTIAYFTIADGQYLLGQNIVKAGGGCLLTCGLIGFYIFIVLMLVAVDFPFLLPVGDLSHLMKGYQQKHGPIKVH
ncbi:GPR1/FUN34/yaaH family-domain-containing protein [Lipomyces tetrasporus]|uniref:GPR1/FUN34/yaaH family-domain-containing protein n=1 Tax=Lipomyces tetrasporus TaxID=54092 RepID=A0AAD7QPD2_9ASCO|nr:GPR1/FUN34/yaaH family-domain-containing protein [Lipomyces tetrasporus]KAJ8098868.1 GPR1/FUN34/yaaH family-domain-containing protein [Lipomyces tetrasporus]